jgi:xylulokinase
MLAAVGCGTFASVEEAAERIVKVTGTVEPEPEIAARYEEKYQKFKQIYPALKDVYKIL